MQIGTGPQVVMVAEALPYEHEFDKQDPPSPQSEAILHACSQASQDVAHKEDGISASSS